MQTPGGEEVGVEVGVGVGGEEGGGEKEDVVAVSLSQLLYDSWIIGRRRGKEEMDVGGEETYRNEPSKILWMRKSKKCQMKRTRSRFGVSDASVASERP